VGRRRGGGGVGGGGGGIMYIVTSKLEFRSLSHISGLAMDVPVTSNLTHTKFDYEQKLRDEKWPYILTFVAIFLIPLSFVSHKRD